MPRGTKLATGTPNLVSMFKTEVGYVLTAGVAVAKDPQIKAMLAQTQQWLWTQYDWPFLHTHVDVTTAANNRFYTLPAGITLDYPVSVETKWGDLWYPVEYGISGEEYEASDPDRNQTLDPISRWQSTSFSQFEVWPMPSTGQTLRFWGTATLNPLVADSDTCDLDDLLIVLFTAAENQARNEQADAPAKLQKAQALFNRLKGANRENIVFTMGDTQEGYPPSRRNQRIVTVIGNPNH